MQNIADEIAIQLDIIDREVALKEDHYRNLILMANNIYYKRGVIKQIARANEKINKELIKTMFWNSLMISISTAFLIAWLFLLTKLLLAAIDENFTYHALTATVCMYILVRYQILPSLRKLKKTLNERKSFKIQEELAEKLLNADQDFKEFTKQIFDYNNALIDIADQMKSIWLVIKKMVHRNGVDLIEIQKSAERFSEIANSYVNFKIDMDQIITSASLESSIDFETLVFRGVNGSKIKNTNIENILDVLECEKAILNLRNNRKTKS